MQNVNENESTLLLYNGDSRSTWFYAPRDKCWRIKLGYFSTDKYPYGGLQHYNVDELSGNRTANLQLKSAREKILIEDRRTLFKKLNCLQSLKKRFLWHTVITQKIQGNITEPAVPFISEHLY